ncbi:MAG: acyltransferase family protein [Eubacteriales bacterium]|nr:acyltransferase family protein [Eubacteriales bacterium]
MAKERDFVFDSFRGWLIWSMVFFHFVRVGGQFHQQAFSGVVYLCVCIYIMEGFFFISGYFSKRPDRCRETAFKTFMLPYIVFIVVSFLFRDWYFGNARLDFLTPPFALWFLFVAFFYRFFLKDLLRIKHLFYLSIVLYLIAGQFDFLGRYMALGRAVSYLPFFLLGYYCTKEHIDKARSLKYWQTALLGAVLVGISCILIFVVKIPVGWYMLRDPGITYGLLWWQDILMRAVLPCIPIGWIVFLLNISPSKQTYLSYLGMNTMTIYVLHIFIRYILKANGVPISNQGLYVGAMFVLSVICVVVLSASPVVKVYDKIFDKLFEWYSKFKHLIFIYPEDEREDKKN